MNGESGVQSNGVDLLAKYSASSENLGPCLSLSERPVMLSFRSELGSLWSFPYGSIRSLRCKGDSKVILQCGMHTVHLTGLRLGPLFDSLTKMTVDLIQVGVTNRDDEEATTPIVDSILVFDQEMSDVTD